MKRTFSLSADRSSVLVVAATGLVASTYGLVRLAYGLFLPDVQASLAMGGATAGHVAAGASVAYCVGALCGLSAARRSRLLVLSAVLTASLGSVGMAVASGPILFAPAAILASTSAGLASPALVAIIERNVSSARTDRAQAVVNAGTGPGLVAVGLLALVLLPDWRLGIIVGAVVTVGFGVAVLLLDRSDQPAHPTPRSERTPGWARVLVVPAAGAALLGAASAVVWTYGRTHLVLEGADPTASTLAWIALGAGGAATVLTAGRLSSCHPRRAWLITATALAAATAALGLGAGHLAVALVACAVFGWGFVAATSALIGWAGVLVPRHTAPGTSLLFVTLVLGQAVGAAASGSIAEHRGLTTAFVASAALGVVAAACGLGTRRVVPRGRPASVVLCPPGQAEERTRASARQADDNAAKRDAGRRDAGEP